MCHFDGYHTHLVSEIEFTGLSREAHDETPVRFPVRDFAIGVAAIAAFYGIVVLTQWLF